MVDGDGVLSLDVCDGASEFDGAVNDSGRQRQFPRRLGKKILARISQGNQFVDVF